MSNINNNIPTRITQLEEATGYEDGMFFAVAKAGRGTYKIPTSEMTPNEQALSDKIENEIVPAVENSFAYGTVDESEIASFPDGSELPLKVLEIAVEPQQEGSGDPSPTNIRPISGWDEVNVSVCGKNWWGKGNINGIAAHEVTGLYIPIGTWTLSANVTSDDTSSNTCLIYDLTQDHQGALGSIERGNRKYITFTTDHVITSIRFYASTGYNSSQGHIFAFTDIQLEEGSVATEYEPYGNTYTIDLDGTRYGGTLDVVSGVLTVDSYGITITGTESFIYKNSNDASIYGLYVDSFPGHPSFRGDSASVMNRGVCSMFKKASYLPSDQMQDHAIDSYGGGFGNAGLTGSWIRFKESSFADYTIEQAKAKLAEFYANNKPLQIVFPMVTKTYQLSPTQVNSLLGVNNIWADCGDIINAEYIRDLDIVINSLLERIAALEG